MGGSEGVQLGEDLSLDVENLGGGFDDEIRIFGGFLEVGGKGDVLAGRLGHFLGHLPLFHPSGKIRVGEFLGLLQDFRDHIGAAGFIPMDGAEKGDLMPHVPRTHNADLFDIVNGHGFLLIVQRVLPCGCPAVLP